MFQEGKAAAAVRALTSGMTKASRERLRLLVIKTLHVDDSGSDRRPKYFVLGGFIAPEPAWERFAEDWQIALNGPPRPLQYFKMREAFRRRDQFNGWSEDERDAKVAELVEIIKAHVECKVVSAMSKHDFELIVRGRTYPESRENPYYFLFIDTLFAALKREVRLPEPNRLNAVFDRQLGFEANTKEIHEDIEQFVKLPISNSLFLGKADGLVGGLSFDDDKVVLPLQASDLFAWTEHRTREYGQEPLKCTEGLSTIETVGRDTSPEFLKFFVRLHHELMEQRFKGLAPPWWRPGE